jgi:hypothetical protein
MWEGPAWWMYNIGSEVLSQQKLRRQRYCTHAPHMPALHRNNLQHSAFLQDCHCSSGCVADDLRAVCLTDHIIDALVLAPLVLLASWPLPGSFLVASSLGSSSPLLGSS